MRYRGSEVIVGAFVLIGVAIIIFGIFTIQGMGVGGTVDYHALYDNVSTVQAGSPVKYNGLLVGRVSSMTVSEADPTKIRVDFTVAEGTPITDRVEAKITKAGLLGDEYIDLRVVGIEGGSVESMTYSAGRPLEPGARVEASGPFDLQHALENLQGTIQSVDELVSAARGQVERALDQLGGAVEDARQVVSPENRELVTQALADLARTAEQARAMVEEVRPQVRSLTASASDAAEELAVTAKTARRTVEDVAPQIEELVTSLRQTSERLRAAVDGAAETLDSIDVDTVNAVMENLDVTSRNLAEFSREIRERPYRLIRKEKQPEKEFR